MAGLPPLRSGFPVVGVDSNLSLGFLFPRSPLCYFPRSLPSLRGLRLAENNKALSASQKGLSFVGMAGFEPTTSTSQMWRDTGLRYIPNLVSSFYVEEAE